jgi:hypothetical protein
MEAYMTIHLRKLAATAVVSIGLVLGAGNAQAQDAQTCQPGLNAAYLGVHSVQYQTIINALIPSAGALIGQLHTLVGTGAAGDTDPNYATLLTTATTVKNSIPNGRVLITLPDGTVVLDTAAVNNTRANYKAKLINENHNSRLAILAAQEYPCGLGLESKLSTSTGTNEAYFALRAGAHLDSDGTLRISQREP